LDVGRAIAFARSQSLFGGPREWLGSGTRGLWYRPLATPGAPWRRFEAPELRDLALTDVLVSEDDGVEELWVLAYGGGIVRIRDDGITRWRSDSGALPRPSIRSSRPAPPTANGCCGSPRAPACCGIATASWKCWIAGTGCRPMPCVA
jgi:hypothetical protein